MIITPEIKIKLCKFVRAHPKFKVWVSEARANDRVSGWDEPMAKFAKANGITDWASFWTCIQYGENRIKWQFVEALKTKGRFHNEPSKEQ